jgi:hypothetical protein
LHVGHRQDAEARRRRSIINEVESLDRRIQGLERDYVELLDQRKKLATELETLDRAESP